MQTPDGWFPPLALIFAPQFIPVIVGAAGFAQSVTNRASSYEGPIKRHGVNRTTQRGRIVTIALHSLVMAAPLFCFFFYYVQNIGLDQLPEFLSKYLPPKNQTLRPAGSFVLTFVNDQWASCGFYALAGGLGLAATVTDYRRDIQPSPFTRALWVAHIVALACEAALFTSFPFLYRLLSRPEAATRFLLTLISSVALLNLVTYGKESVSFQEFDGVESSGLLSDPTSDENVKPQPNPEDSASFFSILCYTWLSDFIKGGSSKKYTPADLYDLPYEETSEALASRIDVLWRTECSTKPAGKRSLGKVIFRLILPTLIPAAILKVCHDTCLLISPVLLHRLIKFLQAGPTEGGDNFSTKLGFITVQGRFSGYILAASFVGMSLGQTMFLNQYFQRMFRLGMRVRTALISLIHATSLSLREGEGDLDREMESISKADKDKNTGHTSSAAAGNVVNLVSVDALKISEFLEYSQMLWSAPAQIIVALILLSFQLGWAALFGLAALLIVWGFTAAIMSLIRRRQREILAFVEMRIESVTEMLSAMKVLKMYGWEDRFAECVDDARKSELSSLWGLRILESLNQATWFGSSQIVCFGSFLGFLLLGNYMDAATAFTAVSLVNVLRFPLFFLPNCITQYIAASLSTRRIQTYVESELLPLLPKREAASVSGGTVNMIDVKDASIDWSSGVKLLENVNFTAPLGSLTIVIGKTGTGKTGLIQCLLGELSPRAGSVTVGGSIGYCAQTPWVENKTVRENILFGLPFDGEWFAKVVFACGLSEDLAAFADGVDTQVGEKGVSLSGGQKQRIALARAVYANCDLYILDDVLSAVDINVAEHIVDNCIYGLLADKTVLLVTHRFEVLPRSTQVIWLDDLKTKFIGPYEELKENAEFHEFTSHMVDGGSDSSSTPGLGGELIEGEVQVEVPVNLTSDSTEVETQVMPRSSVVSMGMVTLRAARPSSAHRTAAISAVRRSLSLEGTPTRLAVDGIQRLLRYEGTTEGKSAGVSREVYIRYFEAWGGLVKSAAIILFLITPFAGSALSGYWLARWSDRKGLAGRLSPLYGMIVYSGLILGSILFSLGAALLFNLSALRGSRSAHEQILHRFKRAPVLFYDLMPLGRILNLMTRDISVYDTTLPQTLRSYFNVCFMVSSTMLTIVYVLPWCLIAIPPILMIHWYVTRMFLSTSQQLQRMDAALRAPILQNLTETLSGASFIRATRAQHRTMDQSRKFVDIQQRARFLIVSANRWLAVRMEMMSAALIFITAMAAVFGRNRLSPGLAALAISQALQVTNSLNWLVRWTSDRETHMVTAERLQDYASSVPSEAKREIPENRTGVLWPETGSIVIKDLRLQYRPDLPLVLHGLSVTIAPGEKIAIVGRTGAGKSSLFSAILRLVEPCSPSPIWIDNVDITKIGLHDLRRSLSIIPQESFLFIGSLRRNLDPMGNYTDSMLWDAIRRANLSEYLEGLPNKLDFQVQEGGRNISVGQRQLVCLARAILSNSKILLLDEATSSVDVHTERLILNTIWKEFGDATLLTVAHRLNSIIDYDKIMVLDNGKVAEFDTPQKLFARPNGIFRNMCARAGLSPTCHSPAVEEL